jgi:hypothetical protein
LAPELEALAADLTTATGVNRALGQVFRLLAQNRITRKNAVAFGYIAQLLLQTVPGVRAEAVSAFGHKAWASHLQSTLTPQPAEPANPAPQATPLTLSSRPAAKVYPPAANVYPQDELRGDHKVELSPLNKVSERSFSTGPIHKEPSPRDTNPANPVDAIVANASATNAFSPLDDESLLSRSLDLLDGNFDASPESRREAHRPLNDLERLTPSQRVTAAESVTMQSGSASRANEVSRRICPTSVVAQVP